MSMFRNVLMGKAKSGGNTLSPEAIAYANKYGVLADVRRVVKERPQLASIINEWNPVIHSLVETGRRNWLCSNGQGRIVTDIRLTSMPIKLEADVVFTSFPKEQHIFGTFWRGYNANNGFCAGLIVYARWYLWNTTAISTYGIGDDVVANTQYHVEYNIGSPSSVVVNGTSYSNGNNVTSQINSTHCLTIFDGADDYSFMPLHGKIAAVSIEHNGEIIKVVPFMRNDTCGMLNLATNSFYANNTFTLITE